MSRKNKKKRYTQAQLEQKRIAKKQAKLFALQKNITIFALLIILILGLVSTTFSTSIFESLENNNSGTLIAQVQTTAKNSTDLASTKANVDVSEISATRSIVDGEYIYFKNSYVYGWNNTLWIVDNMTLWGHLYNSSTNKTHDVKFELYSGTANAIDSIYRAKITSAGNYTHVVFARSTSSSSINYDWGKSYDCELSATSNTYYNVYGSGNGSSRNTSLTVVAPASVIASVTNAVSGTGTSSDPYIVRPGDSYTVELTATKEDAGMEGFGWNIGSNSSKASSGTSSTYTESFTANSSAGTSSHTGYAWCYELDSSNAKVYSNTYTASNEIYVKVVPQYTVTFKDYDGTELKTQTVDSGSAATAPSNPKRDDYTFIKWNTRADGTGTSYSSGATISNITDDITLYAQYKPNAPSALTLSDENNVVVSGNGTQSNPYIVYKDSGFELTAKATVPSGSTAYYSTAANGTYSTTNTFNPAKSPTGTKLSYTVYAKSYANSLYSDSYKSATAYYMAFTHLNGNNTSFNISSNGITNVDSITDVDSITLSGATVNGITSTEKSYITQTYQVSTDNINYTDVDVAGTSITWTPDAVGTYYFRVKTENTVTGEEVVSNFQTVTVTQSTETYGINVIGSGGTVTLKTGSDTINNNEILANSPLTISLTRSEVRYIKYVKVIDSSTNTILWETDSYINGNLAETQVIDHVKGNITIEYSVAVKPSVQQLMKPENAESISFVYWKDGVKQDPVTSAGSNYYVDYGSEISYTVIPKEGYYVQSMTGVEMSDVTAGEVKGTANVTSNVPQVNATLTENATVTVNIDESFAVSTGGSMTIGGTSVAFGTPTALEYNKPTSVVITPPDGYYAVVNGYDVTSTQKDGKAEFEVTLTNESKVYSVTFFENPKIYVQQPKYGSIYITDSQGNFYLNGDSVVCGTTLNVHTFADNDDFKIGPISYTVDDTTSYDNSASSDNVWEYSIYSTTTVSADISGADSNTDYFVIDDKQQQATTSKYSPATFSYSVISGDHALSYSVVDTNDDQPNDRVVVKMANGTLTITPRTNINDCVLVAINSSISVKYYLIRINSFANTEHNELQKIYPDATLTNPIEILLSGKFSSVLKDIGYYISADNSQFGGITSGTVVVDENNKNTSAYECRVNVTSSGVKYYKITAIDTNKNEASVTQKTVFGTNETSGTRNFYLFNQTDYDVSKYSVRVCFENNNSSRYWASMQCAINAEDSTQEPTTSEANDKPYQVYRATVPSDATKVSIYLCDPDKHLVVKSSEGQFDDICYYYVENQITLDKDAKNTIYKMTEFSTTSGMTLQLLQ